MQEFLYELAEQVYKQHKQLERVTVIFPNRRAILYFKKHLTKLLNKPSLSPELLTIEEFISKFSTKSVPDKLELVKRLHVIYNEVLQLNNSSDRLRIFSDFYFWGEMLLRDFEEVDKYMVDAAQLFVNLSNQKEIDTIFEFLSEEQIAFLKEFWGDFESNPSASKERFLKVWKELGNVYANFKAALGVEGLAYPGMLQREVAERLMRKEDLSPHVGYQDRSLVFAGFNALTLVEEKVLSYFVENHNAHVAWDVDTYYFYNNAQEAGEFFREYQKHPVLGKTFSDVTPSYFQRKITEQKPIQIIGASQPVGQVKAMAQMLVDHLQNGVRPEETLIVLPDEKMLLPVLHSIPSTVEKLNVTMGLPLASSPMFNFIELLFDLQLSISVEGYNHRPVMSLLQHAYFAGTEMRSIQKYILSKNWVYVPQDYFNDTSALSRLIFREVGANQLLSYLLGIVEAVGQKSIDDLDKEYAFYFYTFLNRLRTILEQSSDLSNEDIDRKREIRSFQRLFRQLTRGEKIPFAGEPLEGLQIMGVLETRNLDYKNVFILSLNEGALPSVNSKGSYIPYNLRKAYGLPTAAHQDAMYAYLFYRVLQRAENCCLFYNAETDPLGQGEMSRYLQQLIFESGLNIQQKILHDKIQPQTIQLICIEKDNAILQKLSKLNEGNSRNKGISPSALNTYLECRLKFYFKYVAGIREAHEIEEDLDNRVLGNFLHLVMEHFYKTIQARKRSATIEAIDLKDCDEVLENIIEVVFKEAYGLDKEKKITYKGQRLVVREIVKRFAQQLIKLDEAYAPFQLEALEREGLTHSLAIKHAPYKVVLGGVIDRIDRKGDVVRVVDYKTGRDDLNFKNVESLFERDGNRNKAAFQTLLYAMLFSQQLDSADVVKLKPGLLNRRGLFSDSFEFGLKMNGETIQDATYLLPAFEESMRRMLDELFDPSETFDQTTKEATCQYCEFKSICYRS